MSNNIDGGKLSIIGAYENGPRSAVDGRKIIARKPPTRKAICISDDLIERAIFFFFFLYSHDATKFYTNLERTREEDCVWIEARGRKKSW